MVLIWVFIAEEVHGVGDKGQAIPPAVDVQILFEAFLEHVYDICLFC